MGYETTLYIGEPGSIRESGKPEWVDIIASIDLCKVGSHESLGLVAQEKPAFYFYAEGSDRKILRDLYGDTLSVGTRESVLAALRAKSEGDDYRRYAVAIAMLRSLTKKHFPRLVVLGYGH